MAKRHVQVTSEADNDATAVEAPVVRASNGQFQRANGRALVAAPEPEVSTWQNDAGVYRDPSQRIEDLLAEAPADDAPEVAPDADPADPDQTPPESTPAVAAPPVAVSKPPETREVQPTYLNAAQRADVMRKLETSKREREKDAEIKRVQDEHTALTTKLNSPRLADRIAALGKTPEELLEDLLMGRGDADDKAVAVAAGVNPEVAALRAKVDAMEKKEADREAAAQRQTTEAETLRAVNMLATKVNRESGHVMIHALRQHGRLFTEIDQLYDGSTEIGAVTAVVADRIEDQLRRDFPEVAAVLAAGGSPSAVAAAAKADGAPAPAKAKASLGARGRAPTNDEPVNDLPLDPGERHQGTKDRFFSGWRR